MAASATRRLSALARREAILDAALSEFNARGVAGTSIEEIRLRSGASVGSIYHHFASKEGIATALYLDGLGDYQRGFLAQLAVSETTRDGVQDAVAHHVHWIVAHSELARFLLLARDQGVVAQTEGRLRGLNRTFFGSVSEWMAPAIARRELRQLPAQLLTALWLGPSQELARMWLSGQVRTSLVEAIPVLSAAAWKSLSLEE